MANDTDVLLSFVHEHWEEMRHAEQQRSTFTNIVFLVASLLTGFIAQVGLKADSLILTVSLALVGLYGALTTAKLYERHQFDQRRLDLWYTRIDEMHPDAQFLQLRKRADTIHLKEFPRLARIRIHHLWIAFHLGIAAGGMLLTIVILLHLV
jgi:hypothetical protein